MTLECVGELHSPEGQTELELWEQHHISPQILSQSLLTELFNNIFFVRMLHEIPGFVCAVFLECNWKKSWSTFVCRKWVLDKVAHCQSLFVILTGNKVVMVSCYRLFLISSWGGLVAARVSLWGSGSKWLVTLHTLWALCPCVVLCREPFMTLTHDTDGFPCVFNTHPNDSQASSSAQFPWQWELLNTHIWSFCTGWDCHTGSDQPP